jgi:hypothetical protein
VLSLQARGLRFSREMFALRTDNDLHFAAIRAGYGIGICHDVANTFGASTPDPASCVASSRWHGSVPQTSVPLLFSRRRFRT